MHEDHVYEGLGYGVRDLLDKTHCFIAINKGALFCHFASLNQGPSMSCNWGAAPGRYVDASSKSAAKESPIWSDKESFSLPPQENDGPVGARTANSVPCPGGVPFDLLRQR